MFSSWLSYTICSIIISVIKKERSYIYIKGEMEKCYKLSRETEKKLTLIRIKL